MLTVVRLLFYYIYAAENKQSSFGSLLMAGLSEEIRLKQLSKRSRNSQTPMMLNYEMKQTRQTLRKGNLFRTVKDDVLTKFVDMTNMMTFKRGSTIIKQG